MEETVKKLVADIKSNITQTTGSRKDEIQGARAMLNDTTYKVGVYNKSGKIGTVCPSEIAREMSAITISQAARIPKPEAQPKCQCGVAKIGLAGTGGITGRAGVQR